MLVALGTLLAFCLMALARHPQSPNADWGIPEHRISATSGRGGRDQSRADQALDVPDARSDVALVLDQLKVCGADVALASQAMVFKATSHAGVQVRAVQPLKFGQLILSLPAGCLITNVFAKRDVPAFTSIEASLQVTFWLMHARLREKGPWWPYVRSLPEKSGSLLFFQEEELRELQDAALEREPDRLLRRFERKYNRALAILQKEGTDVFASHYTLDLFIWAHVAWLSRYFNMKYMDGQDPVNGGLSPVIDLFNHNSPPKCNQDNEALMFHWNETRREFELHANRDYATGEEVGVCYNPLSNKELLEQYGFAMENNRFESLTLEQLGKHQPTVPGLPLTLSAQVLESPSDTRHTLRMTCAQMDLRGAACHNFFLQLLQEQIRSYPTSLEADELLLAGVTMSANTRSAIVYRKEKKRLLWQVLHVVRAGLGNYD